MSLGALGSPNRNYQEPVSTVRRHEQFVNIVKILKDLQEVSRVCGFIFNNFNKAPQAL